MNLMDLSPDEKDAMLQQLMAQQQPQEEEEFLDPIVNIIEILVQKVQQLEEECSQLKTVVMDEIVGGVKSLYEKNKRFEGIEGLTSKYGEKFSPFMDSYKALNDGQDDLWDRLYDHLQELREAAGEEEFNEDGAVEEIYNSLKGKIESIKGVQPEATVVVEETTMSPEDELVSTIKRMKSRK